MQLFAQIPGADQAIKAAESSGWVAVILVVIIISMLFGGAWLIKKMFEEKGQLGARLSLVEDFQKTELVKLHVRTETACNRAAEACETSSKALTDLNETLKVTGCPYPNMPPHRTSHSV